MIVRQKQNPLLTAQKNVNITVGRTAFLTNGTRSLLLLCPAEGAPQPRVTWTKDGAPIQNSDR